jgi:hypothetical protein
VVQQSVAPLSGLHDADMQTSKSGAAERRLGDAFELLARLLCRALFISGLSLVHLLNYFIAYGATAEKSKPLGE